MTDIIMASAGTLEAIEKQIILIRFRMYRGNKTQTAISLGINVRTLERKLEDYANDDKREQEVEAYNSAEREYQLKRSRGIVGEPPVPPAKIERAIPSADSGVHMEPPVEAPAQHAMPMSERTKVQSVLPKNAASSGKDRRR